MVRLPAAALGLALAILAAPSLAQEANEAAISAGPQATTATYRDWTLRCDTVAGPEPRRICEIVQALRAPDGQSVLAQVVMGRPAPDAALKLIVQLPAGVWLPAAVTISTPSGESVEATFNRCLQLCVADADLEDAFIDALKAATEPGTLTFQDGNRRAIELPISLNGFSAASSQAGV